MALTFLKNKISKLKIIRREGTEYFTYLCLGFNRDQMHSLSSFKENHPVLEHFYWAWFNVDNTRANIWYPIQQFFINNWQKLTAGPVKIKVPTLSKFDYHEIDNLMLHSCFTLFENFVKYEAHYGAGDKFMNNETKRNKRDYSAVSLAFFDAYPNRHENEEKAFLYRWWTQVYKPAHATGSHVSKELAMRITGLPEGPASRQIRRDFADYAYQEETEMLERLLAIRTSLWV